ncbi:MAG TPA: glycosyltransferase family 39 protein [Thermoanaerobaculia bacterium]|nr:glycosyltransferase family 39 protein [Thermoanaerobaculia bacterium]
MNLVWGAATVALATFLFALAWRAHRGGDDRRAILAILAAGLVLRLYAGADLFLHTWDERYHALVAKHLLAHPATPTLYDRPLLPYDYRDWRANHVWLHKPPLALWLMAAGLGLGRIVAGAQGAELAMRLPGLLLSTAAIYFTWRIGAHLCGRRAGLLAAFFHATNGYLLQLPGGRAPVDHVDNDLLFFVELGIFLSVLYLESGRRALVPAIGAAVGLAVLTKWLPGLLALPVFVALAWGRERPWRIALDVGVLSLAATALALPWQVYTRLAFPREAAWESAYNLRHLLVPIEGLGGSPLFYLDHMARYFGELVYLPLAWFLVKLARERQPALLRLAVWLLLPYAAFSLAATKMAGYVMPAAPALFLVEALFWLWLLDLDPQPWPRWRRGLRWAALALLVALPLRYTVERLKLSPGYDRNPPWVRAMRQLPSRLGPGRADRVVLLNVDRPLELMFYTPCVAYRRLATPEQIAGLRRDGYRVIAFDDGHLPPALRTIPGLEVMPDPIPPSPLNDGTGPRLPKADGSDSPLAGMAPDQAAPNPAGSGR